jgi:hypothetical protein
MNLIEYDSLSLWFKKRTFQKELFLYEKPPISYIEGLFEKKD